MPRRPRKKRVSFKASTLKGGVAKAVRATAKAANTRAEAQAKANRILTPRGRVIEDIKKQQRSANAKVNRLRKSKGAEIHGTGYDPRVNLNELNNKSLPELRAISKKFATFNDRRTQFVAGSAGVPIPAELWNRYKHDEMLINQRNLRRMKERGELRTPGDDMTIAQRRAMLADDSIPHMEGEKNAGIYNVRNRESWQVKNADALKKLINNQQKVLRNSHLRKEIAAAKESLYKMIDSLGDDEASKSVRKLTNHQVDVLWFDYNYVKDILPAYAQAKGLSAHGKDAEIAIAMEDDIVDVRQAIDWAAKLPRTNR